MLAGAWTGLSLFAGRAMQVYTSALVQKNMIENAMGKVGSSVCCVCCGVACLGRCREPPLASHAPAPRRSPPAPP